MSLKNLEYISISEGWGLTLVAYKKTSISSYTSKTADTLISFLEDFGEWWDGHFINILRNFTKYLYISLTSSNLLFCTNVIKTNLFRHIQSIWKDFLHEKEIMLGKSIETAPITSTFLNEDIFLFTIEQ